MRCLVANGWGGVIGCDSVVGGGLSGVCRTGTCRVCSIMRGECPPSLSLCYIACGSLSDPLLSIFASRVSKLMGLDWIGILGELFVAQVFIRSRRGPGAKMWP